MHAEPAFIEEGGDTQAEAADAAEKEYQSTVFGNFMDVLMPAKPPEPKNARIVRQFDLEAAKTDSRPEPMTGSKSQPESRSREEARALRNRSLRAAAGLD